MKTEPVAGAIKVGIQRFVTWAEIGGLYQGYVVINSRRFLFTLRPLIPIVKLCDEEENSTGSVIGLAFALALERERKTIELDDKELLFFKQLVIPLLIDFYNKPHNSDYGQGFTTVMPFGTEFLTSRAFYTANGILTVGVCMLRPDECAMLSAPKFGCKFE